MRILFAWLPLVSFTSLSSFPSFSSARVTPQQESHLLGLTPLSVPERSAGRLLASEVRNHAGRRPDMDLLLFFIFTDLKMPIFHPLRKNFSKSVSIFSPVYT